MSQIKQVQKPIARGKWRKYFGKRYFILKRKLLWWSKTKIYAIHRTSNLLPYNVFEHRSTLLRPLKDVDMKYQHNKVKNLELAIAKINNILIKPGETFSIWYLVGKPSKSKGYLKGLILNNGKIGYDYGGGLCQLGNLLYWIVLHSPLTVTERWRHGFDVFPDINRKLPFGSGATLSYNYIDLQILNETQQDFQINLYLTNDKLHGQLLTEKESQMIYEVYEDFHIIQPEFWGGYSRHNRLNRKVIDKQSGEIIDDVMITENHAIMMYEPMLKESN